MPSSHDLSLQESASQFSPTQFHPEFGYLAPTLPLRVKTRLVLKAIAFGAIAGAIAVFALVPGRDPPVLPSAHASPVTPGDRWHSAPTSVSYLAPSLAVPLATALQQRMRAAAPSKESMIEAQPPAVAAATPKPKKRAARQPKREQEVRRAEPDPRSAYAASVRRFAQPQRDSDRRGFWNW